jgi:hypothetical protein
MQNGYIRISQMYDQLLPSEKGKWGEFDEA